MFADHISRSILRGSWCGTVRFCACLSQIIYLKAFDNKNLIGQHLIASHVAGNYGKLFFRLRGFKKNNDFSSGLCISPQYFMIEQYYVLSPLCRKQACLNLFAVKNRGNRELQSKTNKSDITCHSLHCGITTQKAVYLRSTCTPLMF